MVRTTEDLGRRGGVCAEAAADDPSVLDRARKLFAGLSRGLDREIERLERALEAETDESRVRKLTDLIRLNQKALQIVLDHEGKLPGGARAGRGEGVIDLAEARAEIARRLARLAG
jgi:hypothetical protein